MDRSETPYIMICFSTISSNVLWYQQTLNKGTYHCNLTTKLTSLHTKWSSFNQTSCLPPPEAFRKSFIWRQPKDDEDERCRVHSCDHVYLQNCSLFWQIHPFIDLTSMQQVSWIFKKNSVNSRFSSPPVLPFMLTYSLSVLRSSAKQTGRPRENQTNDQVNVSACRSTFPSLSRHVFHCCFPGMTTSRVRNRFSVQTLHTDICIHCLSYVKWCSVGETELKVWGN